MENPVVRNSTIFLNHTFLLVYNITFVIRFFVKIEGHLDILKAMELSMFRGGYFPDKNVLGIFLG